jgi:hypothetical protein
MGLDGVELLMNLEEAFGVEITDEEATNCKTPRMVIDLIVSKLNGAEGRVCRSQRAFYIIRRLLVRTFGLERKSIRPDTRLREFFPEPRQKELWDQLKAALTPGNWPPLKLPLWMSRCVLALCIAVFPVGVIIGLLWPGQVGVALGFGVVLVVLAAIIAFSVTRPYCTCVPASIVFIRDVIPYAMTSDPTIGWTRREVSTVVKRITMDQLGLYEASYTEDSRFIEDFHMG